MNLPAGRAWHHNDESTPQAWLQPIVNNVTGLEDEQTAQVATLKWCGADFCTADLRTRDSAGRLRLCGKMIDRLKGHLPSDADLEEYQHSLALKMDGRLSMHDPVPSSPVRSDKQVAASPPTAQLGSAPAAATPPVVEVADSEEAPPADPAYQARLDAESKLTKLAEEKITALASSKSKLMLADRTTMKPWLAHALDTVTEDWRVLLTEGRAGQKYATQRKRKASGAPHESDEHDSEEEEQQSDDAEAPDEPRAAGKLGSWKALQKHLGVQVAFKCRRCGQVKRERSLLSHRTGATSCTRSKQDKRAKGTAARGKSTSSASKMPATSLLAQMWQKQPPAQDMTAAASYDRSAFLVRGNMKP